VHPDLKHTRTCQNDLQPLAAIRCCCLESQQEDQVFNKAIIVLTAAVALGCVPVATDALAAGHPSGHARGGHATAGHAMGGPAMGGPAMGGPAMGGPAMAGHARGGHGARYGRYYRGGGYYEGGAPINDGYGGGGYYEGGAPIYDSCGDGSYGPGYGCPGYGVPLVGGVIDGIFGSYGRPY
jgi:hypothetical protein